MSTYAAAGVDLDRKDAAMGTFLGWLKQTHGFPGKVGRPVLENGFYAAIHDLGGGLGAAISTDSVGTKALVAEAAGRYETIGYDCVAINANDVLSVGARPIALVDYLAVQGIDEAILAELGKGLHDGARDAGLAIAGGELAQVPEVLRARVDLAGTCLGVVSLDKIIDGRNIRGSDVIIGLASSGLHANGYTLARKVLLDSYSLDQQVPELGCTLAEELLKPTTIYVPLVLEMLQVGAQITGLAHISGGGLLNLLRFNSLCGFYIDTMPEVPPIFRLIAERGQVAPEEMWRVFNMGIGFCIVARHEAEEAVLEAAQRHQISASRIGFVRADAPGKLVLNGLGLVGEGNAFRLV